MKNPPRSPSIKALREIFQDKAPEAKRVLRMNRAELEATDAGAERVRECFHPPEASDIRMHVLNALGEFSGVEAFETSRGELVEYLNAGDTYTATLVRFRGSYLVSTWGDIAERHGSEPVGRAKGWA